MDHKQKDGPNNVYQEGWEHPDNNLNFHTATMEKEHINAMIRD